MFSRCLIAHLIRRVFVYRNFTSIRQITINEQSKRKILSRINTVFDETENLVNSDTTNLSFLNNELIISERMVKFPFHYRCLLEQQLSVCQDHSIDSNQWKDLYQIIGSSTKPLFASITMLVCVQLKHIERARSLWKYLQDSHPELLTTSSTTSATYMQVLAQDFFKTKTTDYSKNEKEILDIYKTYIQEKKSSIFTSAAALGVIKGLCVTSHWREAFDYLVFIDDASQLEAMTDLILASLHNDDLDTGINIIKNLKISPPNDSAAATSSTFLTEMICDLFKNLNEQNPKAIEFVKYLFGYLSKLDYFVEKSAIDQMEVFFSKTKLKFGTTIVYPNGTCKQIPGLKLQSGDLPDEDFEFLRQYLLKSAYTDKEVYNTTTPKEFEKFQKYLSKNQFTMIVDGLNILYGIDRFSTDPVKSMTKTINFLKNLRVQPKQLLFIARKHVLTRIPTNIQNDLRSLCEIFLVDNTSRDDWFVLYAALHFKAYVLTSDILRKERGIANKSTPAKDSLVNEKLQKWLYRYQYLFVRQGNRVYFKQPMGYKLRAQCINDTWLIPYFIEKPMTLAQRPDQWFFLSKLSGK